MKLLLLSLCGRDNEDEDVRYLNLYLASLRRHVIPHFDTQVLLFSTFNTKERTQARVEAFGLTPHITVRRLDDIDLPEEAVTSIKKLSHHQKIGLHMNVLFDYAQQHQFYNADWIFHTDTDIEFLNNFSGQLTAINHMRAFNPRILISCAGDSSRAFIRYKDIEYQLLPPNRWHAYTESYPPNMFNMELKQRETARIWHESQLGERLTVEPDSMKIRNDFVGMSREATDDVRRFNWVNLTYVIQKSDHLRNTAPDVFDWWSRHEAHTELPLHIAFNLDKGAVPLYDMKIGFNGLTWVQLRSQADMAKHYSSGWAPEQNFLQRSYAILQEHYSDSAPIWQHDYSNAPIV